MHERVRLRTVWNKTFKSFFSLPDKEAFFKLDLTKDAEL